MSDSSWNVVLGVTGLLINGIGLSFVAVQVILARRQVLHSQRTSEAENTRRKREATIDFYMDTVKHRSKWTAVLPDDWSEEEIHEFIKTAYQTSDAEKLKCMIDYLGYFETLAVAVSAGVYDLETLDSLAGTRIRRIAANYQPYFAEVRRATGVKAMYVELEWLADRLAETRAKHSAYVIFANRGLDP